MLSADPNFFFRVLDNLMLGLFDILRGVYFGEGRMALMMFLHAFCCKLRRKYVLTTLSRSLHRLLWGRKMYKRLERLYAILSEGCIMMSSVGVGLGSQGCTRGLQ